jgi:hypothetical protein
MRRRRCGFFVSAVVWDGQDKGGEIKNGALFAVRLGQAHGNDGYLPCVFAQGARQRSLLFFFTSTGGWRVLKKSEVFVMRL